MRPLAAAVVASEMRTRTACTTSACTTCACITCSSAASLHARHRTTAGPQKLLGAVSTESATQQGLQGDWSVRCDPPRAGKAHAKLPTALPELLVLPLLLLLLILSHGRVEAERQAIASRSRLPSRALEGHGGGEGRQRTLQLPEAPAATASVPSAAAAPPQRTPLLWPARLWAAALAMLPAAQPPLAPLAGEIARPRLPFRLLLMGAK